MPTRSTRSDAAARARAAAGRATRSDASRPARAPRDLAWTVAALLPALVLLWACRGAPLGVPVSDDYSFLDRLAFQHPLAWLDSMGEAFYWRPVSRQLWWSLIGPWLPAHPGVVAALHLVLLLALAAVLFRVARRAFDAPVAAAIACVPLTSEPARALLGWPSGAQHLLAMLFAAVAVHETLAARRWTAALAALGAVLSHDTAALVLPAMPLIAWASTHRPREALGWLAIAAAIAIAWGAGYAAARAHGVHLPHGAVAVPWQALPALDARALQAAANLEDVEPPARTVLLAGWLTLSALGVVLALGRTARARLAARAPAWLGGGAWFALGVLPLLALLPDWNAWRASLATLGLGFAVIGALGTVSPWLAGGAVALRLAALLAAPIAPAVVSARPPDTASAFSFVRIVRLQRTVDSSRRALRGPGALPRAARVRYVSIPLLTEVGFQDQRAPRVWAHDAALSWGKLGGAEGIAAGPDVVLVFDAGKRSPATRVTPAALAALRAGLAALDQRRDDVADAYFAEAYQAQSTRPSAAWSDIVARQRIPIALRRGDSARADSLNRRDVAWAGETPASHVTAARLALARGDRFGATREVASALTLDPADPDALALARALGMAPDSAP